MRRELKLVRVVACVWIARYGNGRYGTYDISLPGSECYVLCCVIELSQKDASSFPALQASNSSNFRLLLFSVLAELKTSVLPSNFIHLETRIAVTIPSIHL